MSFDKKNLRDHAVLQITLDIIRKIEVILSKYINKNCFVIRILIPKNRLFSEILTKNGEKYPETIPVRIRL
jgi:hypothetical protein